MLCRTSVIQHPSGIELKTPLLVPSFSSKGFGIDGKGQSEIAEAMGIAAEWLTDSMLVSAYDIYYTYLPSTLPFLPDILFVDSGGYETGANYELAEVYRHPHTPKDWQSAFLESVLATLPGQASCVIVNFDKGTLHRPVAEQIEAAQSFFKAYPQHLHDIILKPETASQRYLPLKSIVEHVHDLRKFQIIGVTERELGSSLLKRMKNISILRRALDKANVTSPIHVFGGLDPLTSSLYFLSGAEIFDGLQWLRYAYSKDGLAVHMFNYATIEGRLQQSDDVVRATALIDNITRIQRLTYEMRSFVKSRQFTVFGQHGPAIEKAMSFLEGDLED